MYISRSCSSCAPSAATMTRPMVHCKHNCRASGPASNFTARTGQWRGVVTRSAPFSHGRPASVYASSSRRTTRAQSWTLIGASDSDSHRWRQYVMAHIRPCACYGAAMRQVLLPPVSGLCAPGPHSRPPAWALGRLLDHGSRHTDPSEHSARRRRRCGRPRPGSPSPAGQGDVLAVLLRRLPAVFFW